MTSFEKFRGNKLSRIWLKTAKARKFLPAKVSSFKVQRFTALMNLPKPVTKNNYDKIIKRIHKATKDIAEKTMKEACHKIRGDAGPEEIINTPVSGDGTWQRRGHSSLNGVMTVISIDTGKILDVEAMCRSYKSCKLNQKLEKEDPEAFEEWKSNHTCRINYMGSVNNMEPEGSKRIGNGPLKKISCGIPNCTATVIAKVLFQLETRTGMTIKLKNLNAWVTYKSGLVAGYVI